LKRWLIRLLLILSLFGLLLGPLVWLLGSEHALQWLTAHAPRWVPGELRIHSASGRLGEAFTLEGVAYRMEETQVELGRLDFAWSLPALFLLKLKIHKLHLDDLDLRLPPPVAKTEPGEPPAMPEIKLPISVVLEDLRLRNIRVQQGEAAPFILDQASLNASAGESLEIPALHVQSPQFQVDLREAAFGLQAPHPLRLKLDWAAPLPDGLHGQGNLEIEGDLRELRLRHSLAQPVAARLQASVQAPLTALGWRAKLELDAARWPLDPAQAEIVSLTQSVLEGEGDLENYRIKLDSRIQGPQIPAGHWRLAGQGNPRAFVLDSLHTDILQGKLAASGRMAWQPELSARIELSGEQLHVQEIPALAGMAELPYVNLLADAVYENKQVNIAALKVELPKAGSSLAATGQVDLNGALPQIQGNLEWSKLHWPLTLAESYLAASDQGRAKISGSPAAYRIEIDSHLAGKDIPPGQWELRGEGDDKHFQIAGLAGKLLDGALSLAGKVAWSPQVAWQLSLEGQDLNPGKQWPQAPGKLALGLDSRGELRDGQVHAQAVLNTLKGQLQGYPLDARGEVEVAGENYQVKDLRLKSGSADLVLKAALDKQRLSGEWRLNAPDLKTLLGQAGGSLNTQGKLGGSLEQPEVQLTLQGKALRFEAFSLGKLAVEGDLKWRDGQPLNLSLQADKLQQGEQILLKNARLNLTGKLPAHTLQTSLETPSETLKLRAAGGFAVDKQTWRGTLEQLEGASKKFG
jgi:translocation and assembly module TamB